MRYVKWIFLLVGVALAAPLCAQIEPPPDADPKYAQLFSSGQYHEIFARAVRQIEKGEGKGALGHYRIGYVYERGLQRLEPALAHYYAGLKLLETAPAAEPRAAGWLTAAIERTLQTRYDRIEKPTAHDISVLVEAKSEILAPAKDIAVGKAPHTDSRYPLTITPLPLDEKWVHVRIGHVGTQVEGMRPTDRGRHFLVGYTKAEFRVHVRDVIRFFVEEREQPVPDTTAIVSGYAQFVSRYGQSPLASWARKRIRELEGGAGLATDRTGGRTRLPAADVDLDIPETGAINVDGVAVIIGNRNYAEHNADVPDVEFALRDAAVVKQYLTRMLGFQEGNILYYEDATNAVFRSLFGTRDIPDGRLAQLVKPGKSDVFVYYSGHGAPDVGAERGYFVPVDCAPGDVRLNGYSLDLFYDNLKKIEARSTTIAVDACFSGGSQEGMLIQSASPVGIRVTNPALALTEGAVFTSSSGDEISSWYPEMGHGLFTYFFLKALRGAADLDGDRRITAGELGAYVADRSEGVPYWARRLYQGRQQTPGFYGDGERVLVELE